MFLLLGWILALLSTGTCSVIRGKEPYFRAHLKSGSTIGHHSNVRFNVIDYQIGNAYNPTSGVFRAPVSGLYQFMVHAQSKGNGISSYSLINEGKLEIATSIHSAWDSSSFTTIVHVKQGNHVSVRKTYDDGSNAKMYYSTQFAGYLLRAD